MSKLRLIALHTSIEDFCGQHLRCNAARLRHGCHALFEFGGDMKRHADPGKRRCLVIADGFVGGL